MRFRKRSVLLIAICAVLCLCFTPQPKAYNEAAVDYYESTLDSLRQQLAAFKSAADKRVAANVLKQHFLQCRNTYKHVSFFIEHFDSRTARQLNGPDLLRIEDDTQQDSTKPHGFQHIESILYARQISYKSLSDEIGIQIQSVVNLRTAPDHQYYFRDDRIWEALRQGVYRIISLGITGFDVPLSLHALPETRENLAAMQNVVRIYQHEINAALPGLWEQTNTCFATAVSKISPAASFNSFDRLSYIKDYLNPLSQKLKQCAFALGMVNGNQLTPLNAEANNLFSTDIFNINFFSPNDRYLVTPERVTLGYKLFRETRLSASNTRSCATCHKPERAFTDGLTKATPIRKGAELRNTPSLWNGAFQMRQFYDSRALVLETQLDAVVHSQDEMGGSLLDAASVLSADTSYARLFVMAYPGEKVSLTPYTIANAIASYIRTLVSFNSDLDKYMRGQKTAMTNGAKRGFNLFMGKAKCGTCHYAPMFNGLVPSRYEETESEILAVPATAAKAAVLDNDEGKYRHTGVPIHKYAFKTPTVRNVALTAPYMHNGVFKTLEQVIDFYNDGGGAGRGIALATQTLPTDKLQLSKQEKSDLKAFLSALTDTASTR